jgi:porphobilinogen synthase
MVRETRLTPDNFILPLFVCEGDGVRREVPSMPGVCQLSVDEAVKEATAAKADGVPGVLLFGCPPPRITWARSRRIPKRRCSPLSGH